MTTDPWFWLAVVVFFACVGALAWFWANRDTRWPS